MLDASDAYQNLRRTVALSRLGRVRGLEAQVSWWHARHGFARLLLIHLLLRDTVRSAAERHIWREAGATSARAATSVCTAIYRRRWGCETALQGARLRLARAYLAAGGDARGARGATRPTFDPGDADHFAAAASPVLRGLPAGQRG